MEIYRLVGRKREASRQKEAKKEAGTEAEIEEEIGQPVKSKEKNKPKKRKIGHHHLMTYNKVDIRVDRAETARRDSRRLRIEEELRTKGH